MELSNPELSLEHVPRRSIVDDLRTDEVTKGHGGYPILFQNRQIRTMLKLAKAGKDDIFCDLGCGLAQNLIVAASEFNVRKAVGYEQNKSRFEKAVKRIELKGLSDVCEVINEKNQRALDGTSKKFNLAEATIVFYGLGTSPRVLESLRKRLQDGCRLVYPDDCLSPEIMPEKVDIPFYLSTKPFIDPTSELEWLRAVVGKERSLFHRGREPDVEELWDDLRHDLKYFSGLSRIKDYKQRFRRLGLP